MSTTTLKAIDTTYNGYRFRSRLEARWAVFFDNARITYEYEKEGFDLDGLRYLPDFWLPEQQCWCEIKPMEPHGEGVDKALALSKGVWPVHVAHGLPFFDVAPEYSIHSFWHGRESSIFECFLQCFVCQRVIVSSIYDHGTEYMSYHCDWCDVIDRCTSGPKYDDTGCHFYKGDIMTNGRDPRITPRLKAGYDAAKQARFEFGR